jgi:hypothetical protein
MPMVAQPLRELPEPPKIFHRLVAVPKKIKMASVGSSRIGSLAYRSRQNPPILKNQFLLRWMCHSTDCRFETVDF